MALWHLCSSAQFALDRTGFADVWLTVIISKTRFMAIENSHGHRMAIEPIAVVYHSLT